MTLFFSISGLCFPTDRVVESALKILNIDCCMHKMLYFLISFLDQNCPETNFFTTVHARIRTSSENYTNGHEFYFGTLQNW